MITLLVFTWIGCLFVICFVVYCVWVEFDCIDVLRFVLSFVWMPVLGCCVLVWVAVCLLFVVCLLGLFG